MNINYNNAKAIYRIYKREGRVKQTPTLLKKHVKAMQKNASLALQNVGKDKRYAIIKSWNAF